MKKFKLISSLSLLLVLIMGMLPIIASAQMGTGIISVIERSALTDIYCDGNYHAASFTLPENHDSALCSSVTVTTIPANVVDWILVELRAVPHGGNAGSTSVSSASGDTVIARKPAFLLSNGRIVDAVTYSGEDPAQCTGVVADDNCPDVVLEDIAEENAAESNDLYLVIRHRNHLDIISAGRITEGDDGTYAYDFTQAGTGSAFSNNKNAQVMLGGDTNGDNSITTSDYLRDVLPNIPSSNVYEYGDIDLTSTISSTDYVDTILINTPATGQVPQ